MTAFAATAQKANANPSKSFFIQMLTRDIDLVDCILDLLDNSVDGITQKARRLGEKLDEELPFAGYAVDITFDKNSFAIQDRSGGIPISIAQEYAFRFGRPDDAPALNEGSIGLYGIGMKRAIFKMGNLVKMASSTGSESFELVLNVAEWRRNPQVAKAADGEEVMEWAFDLSNVQRGGTDQAEGTSIYIEELYENIQRQFDNPIFRDRMVRMISRDYAFILNRGLQVTVNGVAVAAVMPVFKESPDIAPFKHAETIDGVRIEVTAGFADAPPDDTSATARNPDVAVYGWYVVCNDRVVVSADKSSDTGWGVKPVPAWHPQFGGFMGVARFESSDPTKLPWKTTKRDVESTNTFYQRTLPVMMRATKKLTDYTNARRSEAKRIKRLEKAAVARPVQRITTNAPPRLPKVSTNDLVVIEYTRELADVEAAAQALGLLNFSPTEVGIRTFEYFLSREVL